MDTAMAAQYRDRWIECSEQEIRIRGYYFPWGTKHIPYTAIRSVRRIAMGPLTGRGRIWGTGNPRYWAGLDPERATKDVAFVLDVGRAVRPFVTPEDPDAFAACLCEHTEAAAGAEQEQERGPFI
jgi:hypothetical protein